MVPAALVVVWSIVSLIKTSYASLDQQVLSVNTSYGDTASTSSVLRRFQTQNDKEREELLEAAYVSLFHTASLSYASENALENANADVWQVASNHVDIYLPPSHDHIFSTLGSVGLPYNDSSILPSLLDTAPKVSSSVQSWSLMSLTNSTFHEDYHPLGDVGRFVDELVELHPNLVTRTNIGHSSEGREMYALTISRPKANGTNTSGYARRVGFVLTGAQHAREVSSLVLYF